MYQSVAVRVAKTCLLGLIHHSARSAAPPMTDKAVEMVMERWKEAVVDEA